MTAHNDRDSHQMPDAARWIAEKAEAAARGCWYCGGHIKPAIDTVFRRAAGRVSAAHRRCDNKPSKFLEPRPEPLLDEAHQFMDYTEVDYQEACNPNEGCN